MTTTTTPANDFLGDGHSVKQALDSVGPLLEEALSPTNQPSPTKTTPTNTMPTARPEQLRSAIESVDLGDPLGDLDDALAELGPIWLNDAVRYDSPRYLAHLNCPITQASFAASVISAGMNTAVESWDQARGAALIEDRLVRWLAGEMDMDPKVASGVFTSGGTQSNLQALYTAREKATAKGHALSELVVVCSAAAHYSIARSARILGLPEDSVVTIATTDSGAMDFEVLSTTLDEIAATDQTVMCVVFTAGTTDLGAIDPLSEAIETAHHHGAHVHVDCAYGGALVLSPTRRDLLSGINQADTVSVDFHKSFFQSVSCAALIYRDDRDLAYVAWHADYLNRRSDDRLNLADRSLQTTRRFDALKIWLTLRSSGAQAIGRDFDTCCDLATHTAQSARDMPDIEVLTEPNLSTVLFRFAPSGLSNEQRSQINEAIRRTLFDANALIIASTIIGGESWLKFTLLNPSISLDEIREALRLIEETGQRLINGDQA